jgi:hypothetical protein
MRIVHEDKRDGFAQPSVKCVQLMPLLVGSERSPHQNADGARQTDISDPFASHHHINIWTKSKRLD